MFQPGPDWSGPPMAVLLNKTDLLEPQEIEELEARYRNNSRAEQVGPTAVWNNFVHNVCCIRVLH